VANTRVWLASSCSIGILEMHFDSFMLVLPFLSVAGNGFYPWEIGVVAPIK